MLLKFHPKTIPNNLSKRLGLALKLLVIIQHVYTCPFLILPDLCAFL